MINSSAVYKNTKNIDADGNLLDVAMECAYFMEQIGVLGYRNWDKGEIVNGPHVSRFFSTISLMFSAQSLPDITVIDRLKNMDCKISHETDTYRRVVTYKEGNQTTDPMSQKVVDHKVWIVTIKIPNRYLALDGNTIMNIDGEDAYYDDIEIIYNDEVEAADEESGDFGGGGDTGIGGFEDDDMEL